VLPLRLEPDRKYQLSINNEQFQNFRNAHGEPAVPYPIRFHTGNGNARPVGDSGPRDAPLSKTTLAHAFDALWHDMDRHYSYFALKKIDWPALKRKYRPEAVSAKNVSEFVRVVGRMLGELDDGHVWFTEPAGAVVARAPRPWKYNGNVQVTEAAIENRVQIGKQFAEIGTSKPDGFGVIRVIDQSQADAEAAREVVEFIRAAAEAPGFVVDLRLANGGSEPLAQLIASAFCASDTVYARSKYRNGPKPTDFGPAYDRVLRASLRPFTKPVVCIIGPGCVSSGEGFAKMMACLPHVTTVGLPSRGSSGNPAPFALPGVGVTVMYSRWVDMLPDGTPVEGHGVVPQIVVDCPVRAYAGSDPTWEKAVAVLCEKTTGRRVSCEAAPAASASWHCCKPASPAAEDPPAEEFSPGPIRFTDHELVAADCHERGSEQRSELPRVGGVILRPLGSRISVAPRVGQNAAVGEVEQVGS
jgi:hypothetical protein